MPRPSAQPAPSDTVPAPESLVRDASLVVALFGRFELREAELCGLRLTLGRGNVPQLELDLQIPGGGAVPGGKAQPGRDYRLTLRFADVSDLSLADFDSSNLVSAYSIAPDGEDDDGQATLHVALTCAPGCDLDFHCREVAVVDVAPLG